MDSLNTTTPNLNTLIVRIFSFSLLIFGATYLKESLYNLFFFSILFAHYVLQYIYSPNFKRHLLPDHFTRKSVFQFGPRWIFLIAITYVFLTANFFQTTFTFGIHFVLTEVYAENGFIKNTFTKISHYLTSAGIYSFYMFDLYPFTYVPRSVYILIFSLGIVGFFVNDYYKFGKMKPPTLALIFYELIGIFFLAIFPTTTNKLINIIFYHVVWWGLYPALKPSGFLFDRKKLSRYIAISALVTAMMGFIFTVNEYHFLNYAHTYGRLFGSLHIISSFFLSTYNPAIISSLFSNKAVKGGIALD